MRTKEETIVELVERYKQLVCIQFEATFPTCQSCMWWNVQEFCEDKWILGHCHNYNSPIHASYNDNPACSLYTKDKHLAALDKVFSEADKKMRDFFDELDRKSL